jgi:anti-sigma regulatory factor (Ser/Thr protein kinase)
MRELTLTSDESCAGMARDFAARCMEDEGISESEAFDMLLALNEAVTNACRHAFAGNSGGEIRVNCGRRGREFTLTVSDSGGGFKFNDDMFEMPDPLSMRGRGFFLMKELMDNVDVRSGGIGTVVSLRRRVGDMHLTNR